MHATLVLFLLLPAAACCCCCYTLLTCQLRLRLHFAVGLSLRQPIGPGCQQASRQQGGRQQRHHTLLHAPRRKRSMCRVLTCEWRGP
jgi:hypothetical protein